MAGEQTKAFIDAQRKAGKSDIAIFNSMLDIPKLRSGIEKGNSLGYTNRQIAQGLGLNIPEPRSVDLEEVKHKSMLKEAKKAGKTQAWESGLLGFSDLGAGVVQGATYAADGISGVANKLLGTNLDTKAYERFTQERKDIEDWHNLRREANDQGFDIARLGGQIAGTGPMAAAGRGYQGAKILSKVGAEIAAHNAALGAGVGGLGFASDSNQRAQNMALGAIGGAAGGIVGEKIGQGVSKVVNKFKPKEVTNSQAVHVVNDSLEQAKGIEGSKIKISDLSKETQEFITNEVSKLLKAGKTPDAKTIQRMVVFNELKNNGFDLKPTAKQATGDPKIWSKETELAKLDGAEALSKKYAQDHENLRGLLDDFEVKTGGKSSDEYQVGDSILSALRSQDQGRSNYIAALYDQAKKHTGNDLLLNGGRFANNMKASLDEDLADLSLLPAPLLRKVQEFADGIKPFTLAEKEILVKQLNRRMSGADGETRYALQSVRSSLEKEVDDSLNSFSTSLQGQAKTAWDDARKAASNRFGLIDRTPALKAALSDAEPDRAFDKLVWRGNVRELESMLNELKSNPDVINGIKQMVVKRIADKSIGISGVFSPKGMNDALDSIGDRKLALLFQPDELKHLKNIFGASKYLISQPVGANVNHSGTSAAIANLTDYLSKTPIIKGVIDKYVISPTRGINASIKMNQGSKAISQTAINTPVTKYETDLIDRLVKAGIISGANLPNQ